MIKYIMKKRAINDQKAKKRKSNRESALLMKKLRENNN